MTSLEDKMEILEKNIIGGHLAPTAPDTLGNKNGKERKKKRKERKRKGQKYFRF